MDSFPDFAPYKIKVHLIHDTVDFGCLELTEGYINKLALDENNEVIGYQFVKLGKMMEDIRHGKTPNEAYEKNVGTYGRFSAEQGAVKYIDPREE